MSAAEWIAERRKEQAEAYDCAEAYSALPKALDALEAVLKEAWRIESAHHFHGTTCICGYASHRARSRTEHLTRPLIEAIEAALRGES